MTIQVEKWLETALRLNSYDPVVFDPDFLEDLTRWIATDKKAAWRVMELVEAVLRDPFSGIGKPERLRYMLGGCWSRRRWRSAR